MNKRWIFILCCGLLIALLALYISMGYVFPKVIRVDRLKIENLHLSNPVSLDIQADLILKNPNPISMTIKSIECDVFIDSLKGTHISQVREAKIQAFSEFTLPVTAPIVFRDNPIFNNIGTFLIKSISGDQLKIRLKGKVNVSAWGFDKVNSFDITYNYSTGNTE